MMRLACTILAIVPVILETIARQVAADELPALAETRVVSTLDQAEQPIRYWAPEPATLEPTPILVSLHSWSGDYTQDRSEWQAESVARGWIYLQPNFRGRNDHPEACGSPAAQQDILDAMDWASERYSVDKSRIYLAGASGGGHMSLLMAGRHPERFSAVSAWVGISDLAEWYRFHAPDGNPRNYAQMIAASCGGPPGVTAEVDRQYHDRSPLFFLHQAVGLPLDICAGVRDGRTGSVPIHHSLRAFNELAKAAGQDVIAESIMDQLWDQGRLTMPLSGDEADDPTYGRAILMRRHAGAARVTIFDGDHEALPAAACAWLAHQSRSTKSDRAGADDRP
ncbi:MAG: prolyl oligopeptidase family serine peptidase [Planctomycetaceae bacterium]|nr:prolyl oligopeptidase family serine peptidase [Planctomycetaceae bacterium]